MQIGPTEILLVALLALLLFAPRKLPELAKAVREAADIIRGKSKEEESEEKK
ncbi:MAG: twin-arginine translocase TatA/TatE family subunit [Thermofilum sp.]